MQTDKTTTESKQPLYKVLNEQRTQGDIIVDENLKGEVCIWVDDKNVGTINKEADAAYMTLAVNNLHHLAEALERIHSLLEQGETVSNMQNIIEEALTRIS